MASRSMSGSPEKRLLQLGEDLFIKTLVMDGNIIIILIVVVIIITVIEERNNIRLLLINNSFLHSKYS
jgi:hypothetical protein